MIKVSVIIPVYNVEQYIEECLVSVVNQTLKEIEIICVNDGTKDNSMDVIHRYADKDARIVIVNKENGGLSSARNVGLKHAKGQYVYFLDSDDYIDCNMLEILYNEVNNNNLDNIFFDAETFFENEELKKKNKNYIDYYRRHDMFRESVTGIELFTRMVNARCFRPSACLQMPKREMLEKNHIQFYEGIIHEDQLFTLQTMFYSSRAKHIATPFYKRRIREGSIMVARKELQSSMGYFVCISEFKKLVRQFDITDKETIRAIIHRFSVVQDLAVKAIATLSYKEIQSQLEEYPLDLQIDYSLFVNRVVKEKQVRIEAYNQLKKKDEKRLKDIKNSKSYKIGRVCTYFPRKIAKIFNILNNKGIICVLYALKRKITHEKRKLDGDKISVSIIIPMYNAQKYLRECLDRLLRQTLQSIEIICVNDGSIDDTQSILDEYAKKDSRIVIVNQDNQGAGVARNEGMKIARGEYYLFLDADDIFHEKLCEEAYYKAKYDMADIVLYEADRYNVQTNEKEKMNWVLNKEKLPKRCPFNARHTNNKIYQITTSCPWSKLFRASFVKKHGLQFQNVKNANDVFFVREALALAKRITVLPKNLITYRYNDGTNTQSQKYKAPVEFYKAFKALKEDLQKRGVYKTVEQSYVNMVLKESLFNLQTAGNEEAQDVVRTLLLEEGFSFFELDKYDKSYFYDKKNYQKYRELIQSKE